MADIPLYCDEPTTPEFSAPATAVKALLALARGADLTEHLTTLAKTGLCALTEEEVCALENYAYTWSPNAAAWRAEFQNNPKGFGDITPTEEDNADLAMAEKGPRPAGERYRRTAEQGAERQRRGHQPGGLFLPEGAGRGGAASRTGGGHPRRAGHPGGGGSRPREWNVVMGLLDQMAQLLGEQTVTVGEYEDLFGLLLRSSDLGHIPQTLDAVVLASAGKMRLDAPDHVFVLGLAEGEFPHGPPARRGC